MCCVRVELRRVMGVEIRKDGVYYSSPAKMRVDLKNAVKSRIMRVDLKNAVKSRIMRVDLKNAV